MRKIKKIIFLFLINTFMSTTRFFKIKNILLEWCGYEIGRGTKIVGPINIARNTCLTIGENCWIGKNFTIHGHGDVSIGSNCDIAPEVLFITGSHIVGDESRRAGEGISFKISIGDGCWVGARATLMENITIGKGVVVGSCSLVNKSISKNLIIAGVPAKELKKI